MKPFVFIDLDRQRRLRFGNGALRLVEHLTGKSVPELFPPPLKDAEGNELPREKQPPSRIGISELTALVYAGLKWEDHGLTMEKVDELIDLVSYDYVGAKVGEAINAAFPRAKGRKDGGPVDPLDRSGSNTSTSGFETSA